MKIIFYKEVQAKNHSHRVKAEFPAPVAATTLLLSDIADQKIIQNWCRSVTFWTVCDQK